MKSPASFSTTCFKVRPRIRGALFLRRYKGSARSRHGYEQRRRHREGWWRCWPDNLVVPTFFGRHALLIVNAVPIPAGAAATNGQYFRCDLQPPLSWILSLSSLITSDFEFVSGDSFPLTKLQQHHRGVRVAWAAIRK